MIATGLLLAAAPFLVTFILEIVAYYADFAIVTALNTYFGIAVEFDESSFVGNSMPSNAAITNFIYLLLCLVIFGWWYLTIAPAPAQSKISGKTGRDADVKLGRHIPGKNTDDKTGRHISGKNTDDIAGRHTSTKNTDDIAGSRSPHKTLLKTAVLLAVFGIAFQLLVDSILSIIRYTAPKVLASYDEMIETLTDHRFLLIISAIVLAPVAEELIFRGLTLTFLRRAVSVKASVIISALFFALYHGNPVQGIYAFIAGLLLGQITIHFGSILPAVFTHMMINASAYVIPDLFFSGILPSVLTLIMSAAIIYLVYFSYSRSKKTAAETQNPKQKNFC